MTNKLGIMRHGSASLQAASDALRPLTEFGEDEIHRAARAFPFEPQLILHSSLLRAQQTAAIVHSYFPASSLQCVDYLTPEFDPKACFDALSCIEASNVLIVSHQPLVSSVIGIAIDGAARYGVDHGFLNPANFVVLDFDIYSAGSAILANTYLL